MSFFPTLPPPARAKKPSRDPLFHTKTLQPTPDYVIIQSYNQCKKSERTKHMKTAELKQALAGTTLDSRFCEIYGSAALKTQKARYLWLDNAETPMHNIRLELEERFRNVPIIPIYTNGKYFTKERTRVIVGTPIMPSRQTPKRSI